MLDFYIWHSLQLSPLFGVGGIVVFWLATRQGGKWRGQALAALSAALICLAILPWMACYVAKPMLTPPRPKPPKPHYVYHLEIKP